MKTVENNKNLVSAIITTHNRLELLRRAVDSVLQQTYSPLELIVVDDASTDRTQAYCENQTFTYIRISPENSRGGNYARNAGIMKSSGEYVAFLDDDDYWLPQKIEKQVRLIEEYGCELVHCGRKLEIIQNDGSVIYRDIYPSPLYWGNVKRKILLAICTTTSCMLCKKDALLKSGCFDEHLNFWQEYELSIRLAQRTPFYFVNEPLVVYRVNLRDKARLTNKYYAWKEAVRYIHQKHARLYRKLGIFEKLQVLALTYKDASGRLHTCGMEVRAKLFKNLARIISVPYKLSCLGKIIKDDILRSKRLYGLRCISFVTLRRIWNDLLCCAIQSRRSSINYPMTYPRKDLKME